ncbi:MAG TPA: pitrilysin family protein [Roseimicrobium sp.]|nr:pitrilysin family protein [Roseimicrobium sp.]
MHHKITRLKNGLTVATAEMPHMASVCVGLWVGVGGRHESPPLNGVCHFIEHMLFKGTKKRSSRAISEAVEGIGGYLNAFTTEENTCFYSRAHASKFDELLDVLTDMVLNSTFDPAEIDKERNVIKEEVAMYLDQPHVQVQELLNETIWPDHPLGRPLTGTIKTLDTLGRVEMVAYLRQHYVAPATQIVVAGNITHAEVLRSVNRIARKFPEGRRPTFVPASNGQAEPRVRLLSKKTEQTQIDLGIRVCSRHDNNRYALRVLNALLGENMSSRLFQVVREDNGLAYSISSGLTYFDDTGLLSIAAGVETEKLEKALKLIVKQIQILKETPPTMAELRRARDYLIGQFDLGLEGTENQMTWAGEQLLGYGKIPDPVEVKDRLHEVKPSEVRDVARAYFHSKHINLALVSPMKKADGLERLLKL